MNYTFYIASTIALPILYFLVRTFYKNTALSMSEELRGNFLHLHEKHYAVPSPWIRKHFKLRKKAFPKYLYFRFFVAVFYEIMAIVAPVIYLCSGANLIVFRILYLLPFGILAIDLPIFITLSLVLKRK